MRFLLQTIVTAFALWITTLLVRGITVTPFSKGMIAEVLTFALVAAIFGVVNATVGVVVRFVSLPLYILTLGLFSLIVNGALFMFAAWVSQLFGFGLNVSGFWTGVWGALVLSIVSWVIGLFVRPGRK